MPPSTVQKRSAGRTSRACAKMLIRTGLRCPGCYCLKVQCCCAGGKSTPLSPYCDLGITPVRRNSLDTSSQAAGMQQRAGPTWGAYIARFALGAPKAITPWTLPLASQLEVLHPPMDQPRISQSHSVPLQVYICGPGSTWGSRFYRRHSVLVLNASCTILWPHATFSLTRAVTQLCQSTYSSADKSPIHDPPPMPPENRVSPIQFTRRSPPSNQASRPGPKSRSGELIYAVFFHRLYLCTGVSTDVRVAGTVTRPAGANTARSSISPQHIAKHRGTDDFRQQAKPIHQTVYAQLSKTGKRSFHRAINRARQYGSTRYKGRQHTHSLGASCLSQHSQ